MPCGLSGQEAIPVRSVGVHSVMFTLGWKCLMVCFPEHIPTAKQCMTEVTK
jgi:hypothetical protein